MEYEYDIGNEVDFQFIAYLIRSLEREKRKFLKKYNQIKDNETPVSQLAIGYPEGAEPMYFIDFEENLPILQMLESSDLIRSLKELSIKETEVLFMKIVSDLTFISISEHLGKSVSEAKRLYYHATQKIRNDIKGDTQNGEGFKKR